MIDDSLPKKSVVLLHLKAVGEAPALKNAKFKIDGEKVVADVEKFLEKQLKAEVPIVSYYYFPINPIYMNNIEFIS